MDVATILGLSAFFINYKFEDILSSPYVLLYFHVIFFIKNLVPLEGHSISFFLYRSAIFLDVVAVTALIIYVSRVALGYKQTWDRYQVS